MTISSNDPATIFAAVARNFAGRLDVNVGTYDDVPALRASGDVFAMLPGGELVVRLPPERCMQLVDAGKGRLYEPGGQTYEDWLVVPGVDAAEWLSFTTEALGCARG